MARQFLLLSLMLFSLSAVPPAHAAAYHFVTFQFPPHEYQDEEGEARGAAVETVRAIIGRLGHSVTIEVLPWTRALKMVRTGRADAIFTAYRNAEREKFLDYSSEVLIDQEVYLYRRAGSGFDFDGTLESIRNRRVGIVSTISYGQVFASYRPFVRLDKANQLAHNVEKLLKGRIDLFPSNRYVAEYTLAEMGLSGQVERLPRMVESVPSYIAFTRERDLRALRHQFDAELVDMKESGEYARILSEHGLTW